MVKLSIIIPIYRVEKYIIECLESVCIQLIDGVEVVLINDGSPDKSMEIAKKFIVDNFRCCLKQFVFIDQENQGQSVARNNGIKQARGDFIAFIDSDDYVSPDYIQMILKNIDDQIDVLSFCGQAFNNKKLLKKIININLIAGQYYKNNDFVEDNFKNCEWMCWTRVINNKFFKDRDFPADIYLEDMYLFMSIYMEASNIKHIDNIIYFYRQHESSATNSKSLKYYDSFVFMIDFLISSTTSSENLFHKKLYKIALNRTIDSYIYELTFYHKPFEILNRINRYKNYMSLNRYRILVFRFLINRMREILN